MYENWNEKESSVVAILCFFDKEVLLFYISSSFSLIYNKVYLLAELKNRLKISIFLWRKSCASR